MPIYSLECSTCHREYDIIQSMADRGIDKPYPPSDCCQTAPLRIYTPQADPNGESAFRPFYSEQLSDGLDPVEIRSRAQLKGELLARGLRQYDGDEFRDQMKAVGRWRREKGENARDAEARILYRHGLDPEKERRHNDQIRAQIAQRR